MKRSFGRILVCCLMICLCAAMTLVPAFAAENPTYVVSFRPGANGSFSAAAEGYLKTFGTVEKTAAGNLFVEVEAGTKFPADMISYLQADEGYYYKGGLTGTTVNADATYVAEYGVLKGTGARYTVQYVDATTGAELAESYTGYANAGDTIAFGAKTVQGYKADGESKSLAVTDGAVLSFSYTSDGSNDRTEYVYGADTIVNETVARETEATTETTAETTEATETAETTAASETAETTEAAENIPDESVPLESGSETGETIAESDVPLASGEGEQQPTGLSIGAIAGIVSGTILLAAIIALLLKKKVKKA